MFEAKNLSLKVGHKTIQLKLGLREEEHKRLRKRFSLSVDSKMMKKCIKTLYFHLCTDFAFEYLELRPFSHIWTSALL